MTHSPTPSPGMPPEPPAHPPLTGLLDIIARNTALVLTAVPEQKHDWLASVLALGDAAEAMGEVEMAALLDGVRRVLEGEPPGTVKPGLSGPYERAWSMIVEARAPVRAPRLDMFDVIARNTLAALNGPAEQRARCAQSSDALRAVADDLGDDDLAALLGAISALLAGGAPGEIVPDLAGAYRACWEAITSEAAG